MTGKLIGSLAIAALLAIAPAAAQTAAPMMDCTEANLAKAKADTDKMSAGEKKTMAMKEMTMATDMMGKKDMAACATHLNNAMKQSM